MKLPLPFSMLILFFLMAMPVAGAEKVMSEESPVETPTAGNMNDSLEKIMEEESKKHVSGGYAAHPTLLKYFREKTYTYTGGRYQEEPINYRLREPQATKPGEKYPLVVWLHGAGESDDDNVRQVAHLHHALDYISGKKRDDFYVLATQCPKDNPSWFGSISNEGKGDATITVTREIMHHLLDEYPIDPERVTVAGLSSGGSATWKFAADEADLIAAAAPFSSNPPDGSVLKKLEPVSVWVFNCTGDQGTPIEEIRRAVSRMETGGYKIHLTEYPSASHDSWGPAIRKDDAFGWLLSQRKNDWRSPLPGRPFSFQRLAAISYPLLVPVMVIIVVLVILRDRRLRAKRMQHMKEIEEVKYVP